LHLRPSKKGLLSLGQEAFRDKSQFLHHRDFVAVGELGAVDAFFPYFVGEFFFGDFMKTLLGVITGFVDILFA